MPAAKYQSIFNGRFVFAGVISLSLVDLHFYLPSPFFARLSTGKWGILINQTHLVGGLADVSLGFILHCWRFMQGTSLLLYPVGNAPMRMAKSGSFRGSILLANCSSINASMVLVAQVIWQVLLCNLG